VELIDTHAHLDMPQFDKNREKVIANATREGVVIISCSLDQKGWEKIKGFKELYHTIGCCPYHFPDYEPQYKLLQENVDNIIAVGEIGLDYYWVKEPPKREKEKENFLKLLNFAKEHDKPVIIHSRNAEKQALEILEKERVERALMHCFSGSLDIAKQAIDLGYPISIPTNIVTSKQKQEFAQKLPLESIVLETDAPYLAPEPRTLNVPSNVRKSAELIAQLREIEYKEVAKTTTKTAKEFFRI
jgi:TatD DNase family protein